jgi:outer membrane protein assembly factor BamE (lipoprotein component of BamABCDE complex)
MWIFAVLFLISGLITIVGLLLLIPNKTRKTGKKITTIFLCISLICFFLDKFSGNDYPNEEPGTITKAQYKQIKEGMTKEKVKEILGDPHTEDKDINEWIYIGIDGVEENAKVSFLFNPEDKLEIKLDGGLLHKIEDAPVTVEKNNEDYAYFVQFAIEDTIGEKVDWNGKKKNTVREVEVNDNMGKQDGSKLILIRLNAPISATNNAIKKKVNEATLKISKVILDDINLDFEKDSITFFWYLPLTDSYGNTKEDTAYKISLEKDTLSKINFDDIQNVDLPAIADQYNVLFNE